MNSSYKWEPRSPTIATIGLGNIDGRVAASQVKDERRGFGSAVVLVSTAAWEDLEQPLTAAADVVSNVGWDDLVACTIT